MLFSQSEIEVLRLAGWLKLIPMQNHFAFSMLSPAKIAPLLFHKLLYVTQNKKHLCLTPTGWDFLKAIGYNYPRDSGYITNPDTILRREHCAKMALLFYRAGFSIFEDDTAALQKPYIYMTSTAARRDIRKPNIKLWQGVRMAGIATYPQESCLAYYTDERGLLPNSELPLFQKLIHNDGRCLLAADGYSDAAELIKSAEPFADTKSKRGWATFGELYERLELPVNLLECSDEGATQLQSMSVPSCRQRLAELALGDRCAPPLGELSDVTDAFWKSESLPVIVLLDMNIKRAEAAKQRAASLGFPSIGIVSFESQTDAIARMLAGVEGSMGLIITPEQVQSCLNIRLFEPKDSPYQTAAGKYVSQEDIPQRRRAGRPAAGGAII